MRRLGRQAIPRVSMDRLQILIPSRMITTRVQHNPRGITYPKDELIHRAIRTHLKGVGKPPMRTSERTDTRPRGQPNRHKRSKPRPQPKPYKKTLDDRLIPTHLRRPSRPTSKHPDSLECSYPTGAVRDSEHRVGKLKRPSRH